MREIGLSRRKVKHEKGLIHCSASQDLDIVDGPARELPEVTDDAEQPYAGPPHDTNEERVCSNTQLPAVPWGEGGDECHLPMLAKHVGCHRLDPFVKYPVEMSPRAQLLLDTRKCNPISHPITSR